MEDALWDIWFLFSILSSSLLYNKLLMFRLALLLSMDSSQFLSLLFLQLLPHLLLLSCLKLLELTVLRLILHIFFNSHCLFKSPRVACWWTIVILVLFYHSQETTMMLFSELLLAGFHKLRANVLRSLVLATLILVWSCTLRYNSELFTLSLCQLIFSLIDIFARVGSVQFLSRMISDLKISRRHRSSTFLMVISLILVLIPYK